MAFVLHFSISPFVLQSRFYFNTCYLLERLQETRDYSLKENETVFFLKRQNLFFLQELEGFYLFLFQTKYFQKQDLKSLLPFGAKDWRAGCLVILLKQDPTESVFLKTFQNFQNRHFLCNTSRRLLLDLQTILIVAALSLLSSLQEQEEEEG